MIQQNTQEWKDFRRNKIGASDAAGILGISPFKTPYQVWEEKIFGLDDLENWAMRHGHLMEPLAREEFENMTGLAMMPKVAIHKEREWQMASLDGVSFEEDVFVEIKCPKSKEVHQMACDGKLPDHYMAQMQHQMVVLGIDMGFYFSFNGTEGALVEVKRDKSFGEMLTEKESVFYYDHLMKKEAPPISDKDYIHREDLEWNDVDRKSVV